MKQRIGNVGLLNLLSATEESIKGIESIENVGMVLYRKETAPLISSLSVGNIGKSIEIPDGYSFINGVLNLDQAYFQSITEPVYIMVNGVVIIDKNVKPEQLKNCFLQLIVNGKVYSPTHLAGPVGILFSDGGAVVETYHGAAPRLENGVFTLTNSFLEALDEPQYLVVNGVCNFSNDLDMDMFEQKINKLEINGVLTIFQEQESFLYKKVASLTSCKLIIIPTGFDVLSKPLRLNGRSIRRFKNKKVYTKKPIMFEADVTREMLKKAIAKIHSTSVIICHETIEDLIYELSSILDTEVLAYENSFVMIEGNEVWSNDQFLALNHPANFIVKGQLILDADVQEDVLQAKLSTLDILGEVVVPEKKLKGILQNLIRVNTGRIIDIDNKDQDTDLNNVGELSL